MNEEHSFALTSVSQRALFKWDMDRIKGIKGVICYKNEDVLKIFPEKWKIIDNFLLSMWT